MDKNDCFQSIPAGQFLTAHLPYHPAIHETLERMNFKILVMMRDPRDVVLSWADYIAKEKKSSFKSVFLRIRIVITGLSAV